MNPDIFGALYTLRIQVCNILRVCYIWYVTYYGVDHIIKQKSIRKSFITCLRKILNHPVYSALFFISAIYLETSLTWSWLPSIWRYWWHSTWSFFVPFSTLTFIMLGRSPYYNYRTAWQLFNTLTLLFGPKYPN